jgi:hypothetical protein
MKSLRDIESVGWIFWFVMTALLAPAGVYVMYHVTYSYASTGGRVAGGIFLGGVAAGFVSWGVNELFHQRNLRRLRSQKKLVKKQKRNKKK